MITNTKYDDTPHGITKNMFRVQWHLTERCNLSCRHCYQDELRIKDEMDHDQILKTVNMLKRTVLKWGRDCEVSLTGGEPFLRKDLYDICHFLNFMGFDFSILTNGTKISRLIAAKLRSLEHLKYIQVSLDGGTEAVHDHIRGAGSYKKAIRAIGLLQKSGIPVATKFTIHTLNRDDLVPYLDLTEKLGVNFVSVARYIPCGANDIKDTYLTPEMTREVYETVLTYAKKNEGVIRYDTRRPLWTLLRAKDADIGGRCVAGLNGLTIMPNGDVLPCRPMGAVVGNVLSQTFFDIWYTSDLLWKIRNYADWECARCKQSDRCGGCLAMSKAVNGDYFTKDPQCFKNETDSAD